MGLTNQRTTSNKNSWANEIYSENKFGGIIPDNVSIPKCIDVDPIMMS